MIQFPWSCNIKYGYSYTYDAIGNLTSKAGVGLGYPDSGTSSVRPHAVITTSTGSAFSYDANGNMTQRVAVSGTQVITYQQVFNAENRLVRVTKGTEVTEFTYDGDGVRVKKVDPDGTVTHYVGGVYEVAFTGEQVTVPDSDFEAGTGWSEITKSEFPATSFWRDTWGTAAGRGGSGHAYAISNHAYGYLQTGMITATSGITYDLHAWVRGEIDPEDSQSGWSLRLVCYDSGSDWLGYAIADSGVGTTISTTWQHRGGRVTTLPGTAFVRVRLFNSLSSGWVAYDDVSLAVPDDVTKYYYFGTKRVAMRQNEDLIYLHADHLGSTSLATDEDGEVMARQLYYPYGETRYITGTLPTDFGFTGQREDAYSAPCKL